MAAKLTMRRRGSAANPTLGTIKALDYMRAEVKRVQGVPSDEPSFRALDLNLAIAPSREMLCTPGDLEACFVDVAEYRGPCYVGLDIGEAIDRARRRSRTGLRRARCGRGSRLANVPDLAARGRSGTVPTTLRCPSGVANCGPIAGRTVPVDQFVLQVESDLDGADVRSAVADGYRCGELLDVCPWPLESCALRHWGRAVAAAVQIVSARRPDADDCDREESIP